MPVSGRAPTPQGRNAAPSPRGWWFNSTAWDVANPGPETRLVARMVSAIRKRWPTVWIVKIHGGPYQRVGIPDLLVIIDGRAVGIEVKAQKPSESAEHARERATPTQRATIAAMKRAGAVAGVAVTIDEAIALVSDTLPGDSGSKFCGTLG